MRQNIISIEFSHLLSENKEKKMQKNEIVTKYGTKKIQVVPSDI